MTSRRRFLSIMPWLGASVGAATAARAAATMVDPKDAQAVSLGYVVDAIHADKAKFPKYAGGQACVNCALYQGGPGTASAPCPLYQNRLVPAKAWCGAYVKKA